MSETFGSNGDSPLREKLADRSRFQFKREEIDLTDEITGVKLKVKTLSVAERDALPDLTKTDEKGNQIADVSIPKLAAVFAAVVEAVEVDGDELSGITAEDAEAFLGDWPSTALDKVIEAFGRLTGTGEEQTAAAGAFPGE